MGHNRTVRQMAPYINIDNVNLSTMSVVELGQYIYQLDTEQGDRFAELTGEKLVIAMVGIIRHIKACRKMDLNPDSDACEEVITDALEGRAVYDMELPVKINLLEPESVPMQYYIEEETKLKRLDQVDFF